MISAVLVDEDRVAVGIRQDEAGRPRGRLVGLLVEGHAGLSQLSLELPDIGERVDRLCRLVQPGLKVRMFRSNIPWKRPTTTGPFFIICQPCAGSPWNGVKPSFS
jgi:hypothetical protein